MTSAATRPGRPAPACGHFPQIEQPGALLAAIGDFVDTVVKPDGH